MPDEEPTEPTIPTIPTTVPEPEEPTIPETTVPEVTDPQPIPSWRTLATPAVAGTLPATGSGTTALAIAGIGALIAGLGLVQLASNRRQSAQA